MESLRSTQSCVKHFNWQKIMDSDRGKILGHHYFDPSKEPKSGLAVPKAKYCKVQQEKHRKEFMQQYNDCSKNDS